MFHVCEEALSGPRRDKTCLRCYQRSEFQTSLLSYRDLLENWNFACSKLRYDTFKTANNEGADQTAQMRRLVCACVVHKPPKTGFLVSRPKYDKQTNFKCAHFLQANGFFFYIKHKLLVNFDLRRIKD